jgi:signal transduction histidine kinase
MLTGEPERKLREPPSAPRRGLLGRLEASFVAQRQFVANASHELRTPLARLKTLAQVALADPNASVESLRAAHGGPQARAGAGECHRISDSGH